MSVLMVQAWKCDKCSHIWLADEKPKRCSKCKKVSWDSKPSELGPKPVNTPLAMADQTENDYVWDRASMGHNPATCRTYKCGMCAVAKQA